MNQRGLHCVEPLECGIQNKRGVVHVERGIQKKKGLRCVELTSTWRCGLGLW